MNSLYRAINALLTFGCALLNSRCSLGRTIFAHLHITDRNDVKLGVWTYHRIHRASLTFSHAPPTLTTAPGIWLVKQFLQFYTHTTDRTTNLLCALTMGLIDFGHSTLNSNNFWIFQMNPCWIHFKVVRAINYESYQDWLNIDNTLVNQSRDLPLWF